MNLSYIKSTFTSKLVIFFFLSIILFTKPNFAMEFEKEKYFFSDEEYADIMNLIYYIDPAVYEKLKKCEILRSMPCIMKDRYPRFTEPSGLILPASEATGGYPMLVLDPQFQDYNENKKWTFLTQYLCKYHYAIIASPITQFERAHIFQIIKTIDLQLYEEIIAIDSDGSDHIKRHNQDEYGFDVGYSPKDGFPIFFIGEGIMKFSLGEQRFCLGSALGCYLLEHENNKKINEKLEAILSDGFQMTLDEVSFNDEFQRTLDNEADKFAILELGISIDDAIAIAEKLAALESEHKPIFQEKEVSYLSDSFWSARLQYLNELPRTVEKRKTEGQSKKQINWKELAEDYLKLQGEGESVDVIEQRYNILTPEQQRILDRADIF